ncbi:sulfotransferase [Actinomadura sp. DC4]|uniref:sulfotransferase family protein n=1 Tax=Actinomadura sp. DC4 TaxID=3055069 RepID=UPI0025B067B3|nr:sulfotransferase [Actinomadura sp. DC4]MDN3354896.1 sulfotransferase [Actinomadura sp. DC4]
MSPRPLVFVVGTGRTGSTALSRIFSLHPDILSINELFVSVDGANALPKEPLDGGGFWRVLATPNVIFDAMTANGTPLPEFLYPRVPSRRFTADGTGIPALSLMVLPHLTDDPDELLDALEPEVTSWPARPVARHYEALFDLLAARFGGRVAVERSGHSLEWVPQLRETFPQARFLHMFRDGPDCALSMSRHLGFRSSALVREILESAGVESVLELTPERLQNLPPDLAALLGGFNFDAVRDRAVPVARFGALWSEMIVEGVEHLARIPTEYQMSVKYEELLSSRHSELTRLAEFIGVHPDPEWLRAGAALLDDSKQGAALQLAPDELAELRESCKPGIVALENHY